MSDGHTDHEFFTTSQWVCEDFLGRTVYVGDQVWVASPTRTLVKKKVAGYIEVREVDVYILERDGKVADCVPTSDFKSFVLFSDNDRLPLIGNRSLICQGMFLC
jgi:hypothetical protein